METYIPETYVADFQKEKFFVEKSILKRRARTGRYQKKQQSCGREDSTILFLSFGNIDIDVNGDSISGVIDIKTRTNSYSKPIVNFLTELKYDTLVFGNNAISSHSIDTTISSETIPMSVNQTYVFQAQQSANNRGLFSVNKDLSQDQSNFITINTIAQSTFSLRFTLPVSALENLPNGLETLFDVMQINATYFCNGRVYPFDKITFNKEQIGVLFEKVNEITYYFDHIQYDYDNDIYSIGVFASSNVPTVLKSGKIVINYNDNAFSPSQTPGLLVENDSYLPSFSNISSSSFEIDFSSNASFSNLLTLNSDGQKLVDIILEMSDCTEAPNLSFDADEMSEMSFYVEEETFPIPIVYEPVNATDAEAEIICCSSSPVITSWETTDPSIVAGDNQVLTINGSGFGSFIRGTNPGINGNGSSVLFRNGDFSQNDPTPSPEFIAAAKSDFIINEVLEWTDSKIQVIVPSTDYQAGANSPASSGPFKVRNKCNIETASGQDLNIVYALGTYRRLIEEEAFRIGLKNNDSETGGDGFIFEFDPSTVSSNPSHNNIKDIFGDALDVWCGLTQIRFKKKADVNTSTVTSEIGDGLNTVLVRNIGAGNNGDAGATLSYGVISGQITCGLEENASNAGYIVREMDLVVDDFAYTDQELAVQGRIAHELGHAHMLKHSRCAEPNCTQPLMFPTEGGNLFPTIIQNDIDGANRVFGTSNSIINQSGVCISDGEEIMSVTPILQGQCGVTTSIIEIDLSNVILYPNPTRNRVMVDELSGFTSYILRNSQGTLMLSDKLYENNLQLDLRNFPPGVYILSVFKGSETGHLKIIKI